MFGWGSRDLGEMVQWLLNENTRLHQLAEDWKEVAAYHMGNYTDTHTPAQSRAEAERRAMPRPPVRRG
jgi:hypothetical protein